METRIEKKIKFKNFDEVANFIDDMTSVNTDVDVISNKYIVSAKSIMGLLTLDLSKVLDIYFYGNEESEDFKKFIDIVEKYAPERN
ncbi:MAG: HPr family phosphocarrier protein [Eubacteriales bacterium]|nr:HPr family phosphocarrier protein [Eubacteriales bacterium]